MNIIAYITYLGINIIIIYSVGKICYNNGHIFLRSLTNGNLQLVNTISKLLLTGYYLLNIGYCFTTLLNWKTIDSLQALIEIVSYKTSIIFLLISILHYTNILWIQKFITTYKSI